MQNVLFLHFLNRELLRSVNYQTQDVFFERLLTILLITTDATLYSNFANILEGGYFKSQFINSLIELGYISFLGEKPTIEEHIESSFDRYKFDLNRYVYSELNNKIPFDIKANVLRNFSMTERIKRRLKESLDGSESNYDYRILYELKDVRKVLEKMSSHDGNEAMTISLANMISKKARKSPLVANTVGRVLSEIYLLENMNALNSDIVTGMPGLSHFEKYARKFPSYDIALLNQILKVCCVEIKSLSPNQIFEYRESIYLSQNAAEIRAILNTLYKVLCRSEQFNYARITIINALKKSIYLSNTTNIKFNDLGITSRLIELKGFFERTIPYFKETIKSELNMKRILVLTATSKETNALLSISSERFKANPVNQVLGNHVGSFLGRLNNFEIWHAQCEAGSGGVSGAQAVASELIETLNPTYLLMPGICFGLNEEKQKIGDVVVPTQIFSYEPQRIGEKSISRGDKVSTSPLLLSALRAVSQKWKKVNMHFGSIASGEKLVDNIEFVKYLKSKEPELIAGEMEGSGLYVAATRKKVDWILFKSIVDWGYKKGDDYQAAGSSNASEVLFELLNIITR